MSDCLFCRIERGELPAEIIFQDEELLAFRDIQAQAPTHVLVIPRRHVATLDEFSADDAALIGRLHLAAAQIAREEGIVEAGYRTVINCNAGAGQTVFHVHLHLLGGRRMTWPPG